MNRRFFLLGAALGLSAFPALADQDPLREAFNALPVLDRRLIQLELQLMEVYPAEVDAQYGPMTRNGLIEANELIAARTGGEMHFDLDDPAEIRQYLELMAREHFMFMYDDGFEG